jgi:glycosyltransferase involved in cell wall biosynthesis
MQARSLRNMRPQIRVLRSIKDFKPDVVYVEAWSNPYFALLYNLFLSRQKTIVALMDYKLHQRSKGQLKFTERFYKAYSLTCFHYFQLFSYSQTKYFSQDHPAKKVFTVRLYLVDKDCSKDSIEKKAGVTTFLYFGRIFYYKGVDVLIKAANILGEK